MDSCGGLGFPSNLPYAGRNYNPGYGRNKCPFFCLTTSADSVSLASTKVFRAVRFVPVQFEQPSISPQTLWSMTSSEFNEWRIRNDFPRILSFFDSRCTQFQAWKSEFGIPDSALLDSGISPFIRSGPPSRAYYLEQRDSFLWWFNKEKRLSQLVKNGSTKIVSQIQFIPYQSWAERKRLRIHPRGWRNRIGSALSGRGGAVYLLDELELLKIGDWNLRSGARLGEQLLQFTNANNLKIGSSFITNGISIFHFCSTDNMEIAGNHGFFDFYECMFVPNRIGSLYSISLVNGRFQDFCFDSCGYISMLIERSFIHRSRFRNCRLDVMVENSRFDGVEFHYDVSFPGGRESARELFNFAKRQYSQQLMWEEASLYSFKEKLEDALAEWQPTAKHPMRFGSHLNSMSLKSIFSCWRYNEISSIVAIRKTIRRSSFFAKIALNPTYCLMYLLFIAKITNILVWGAGEKPLRVVPASGVILVAYSILYYFANFSLTSGDWKESIVLSLASFTALTVSDLSRSSVLLRLTVSSEALIGILFLGLLIAGFASKVKTH